MEEKHIVTGKVFYDTGELYFEGSYYDDAWSNLEPWKPLVLIYGTTYYRNGNRSKEGYFQWGGLLMGRVYYESGALKFDGIFNDKHGLLSKTKDTKLIADYNEIWNKYHPIEYSVSYYGPTFPICGKFYSESGELLLDGCSRVRSQGGVGYPKVIEPGGYGSLI